MRWFFAVGRTGLVAVLQYPLRSAATLGCAIAILVPYLAGIGLSQGLQEQADQAIRFGADLYVTVDRLGKAAPIPTDLAARLRKLDGVTEVVPRIVARVVLGRDREEAVLVGMPLSRFSAQVSCVEGRLPAASPLNEIVVGTELARRLRLRVGSLIPPFYHSAGGDRVSRVVGIFKSDLPIWEASLMLTSFETASAICDQQGLASELLVYCRPGYRASVRDLVLRAAPADAVGGNVSLGATTRDDLRALLPRGLLHREGIFNLHFVVAFAVAILAVLVTSGIGTSERRREIGILKATGWQTDEVILRSLVESLLLSLTAAVLSIILAFLWLRVFNGYWIASVFLTGVDVSPGFRVPFLLAPVPALLAFVFSAVIVMTGTLYSSWRAATVPPREAMR
jgi:ABC-type lipoprotein release transport system permease subunit